MHGQPNIKKMNTSCLRAACANHDVGHFWFTLYEITNRTERNGTEPNGTERNWTEPERKSLHILWLGQPSSHATQFAGFRIFNDI